jgi:tRNA(Ile)-lysidine synthetase-like protein
MLPRRASRLLTVPVAAFPAFAASQVLQHTDRALAASTGATSVLTRFRRATTLRLQHLQGDGDPHDILEEEDREAELDQAGAADEPLARTIEGFLCRHVDGVKTSSDKRPGRRGGGITSPPPGIAATSGTADPAGSGAGLPAHGSPAGALLVSLSGGVDSMVLIHSLLRLQPLHNRPVCAVHIDYSNRAESAAEAAYLRRWCEARGVPLRVRAVLEISRRGTPRDEYEKQSRRIRFDAYREAMAAHGAAAVFFGHHMGDLQENVLSNVMKGASVLDVAGAGWRGGSGWGEEHGRPSTKGVVALA